MRGRKRDTAEIKHGCGELRYLEIAPGWCESKQNLLETLQRQTPQDLETNQVL
jgi:hypothetical protein